MRVIAGRFRSRKLKTLPGLDTRPTPDRLRESLFSIIAPRLEGTIFVDAYAGMGAVGIEALSRGAARAIFIERSRAALAVIRENVTTLGLADSVEIASGRVSTVLPRYTADIVFLDPPYALNREYDSALSVLGAKPPKLAIVQHSSKVELPADVGRLHRIRIVRQGDNCLSFYEPEEAGAP
jgi:16S rRNA (guanine(966)-N(2))-methyltransferase RsmD